MLSKRKISKTKKKISKVIKNTLNTKQKINKKNKSKTTASNKIKINYNPKLKIIPEKVIKNNGELITINVIRDDLIPAGSKQRAMIPYFQTSKYKEFVYVSPYTGAAQVSLAYSARVTNKKATIFMYRKRPQNPLTKKALKLTRNNKKHLNIIEVKNGGMKYLEKIANKYVERIKKEKGEDYITKIGLGFSDEEYKNIFVKKLKEAVPKSLKDKPPKRIWVPSGSSIMLNALYKVFPASYFLAVRTGKTIWPDMYNQKNTKLYETDEHFYDRAKIQPPYPTTSAYDAKAWKFVLEDGEDGDYIWNITSEGMDNLSDSGSDCTESGIYIAPSSNIKTALKFKNKKPVYKTFNDKNYKFHFCDINYTNKTDPYIEFVRKKKMANIVNNVTYKLKKNKIILKSGNKSQHMIITNFLFSWIVINLTSKNNSIDPLFPYNGTMNNVLIKTLEYLGKMTHEKAIKIFKMLNLAELFNNVIRNVNNYCVKKYNTYVVKSNTDNKIILTLFQRDVSDKESKIDRKLHVVTLNKKLYKHLEDRFTLQKKQLDDRIFCLLLRYETFMGNSHQFAMETKFKDVLRDEYGINFECFASSINVYYDKYCSLFYDIEKDFGSYGSFYLMKYERGFFIANPPYESEMLKLMVEKFIASCKESKEPLSISFGLPNWGKYDIFEAMEITKKSPYTKFIRCMKDGEVWWYDRLNNIRVMIPSHCRCVVQNEAGAKKYPISKFNDLIDNYWVKKKKP